MVMKLNSEEFKNYILNEVKLLSTKENWDGDLNSIVNTTFNTLNENEFEVIDPETWSPHAGENIGVLKEDIKKEINPENVQKLNEELKRMRELVDFRNPLFLKD